jgi:glycosyltransferase involved in cell wall biosynthesis
MLNYISFMITAPLGSFFVPRCDVMYVWHPPLTVGVAAWLIARLHGIPFIYDVQDIWPETVVLSGMLRNKFIIRMLSMLERFVYRRADHIFVVTRGALENLLEKGVTPEKVSVMPHWIDETKAAQIDNDTRQRVRQTYGWTNKFVSLFAGNIGIVQGLDAVVRAAALLPRDGGFLISLIGDGADKQRLRELAKSLDVDESNPIPRPPSRRGDAGPDGSRGYPRCAPEKRSNGALGHPDQDLRLPLGRQADPDGHGRGRRGLGERFGGGHRHFPGRRGRVGSRHPLVA